MPFYSRSENKAGKRELVADHLKGVAELAKKFADEFGYGELAAWAGFLHDFGKYSKSFQSVLLGLEHSIDHASPGAALAENIFGKLQNHMRHMVSVIMAHHGSLRIHVDGIGSRICRGEWIVDKTPSLAQASEIQAAIKIFKEEVSLPKSRSTVPTFPDEDFLQDIAYMLFDRMLLSSLVDADYSMAATHDNPEYLKISTGKPLNAGQAFTQLEERRKEIAAHSTAAPELNRIREQLYRDCINAAKMEPGLFTLTAPTGTGKTLSLMAFALQHVLAHTNGEGRPKRRIFVVLPYLSIIQQNVKEYRSIFPDLLELDSQAELSEDTRLLADRCSAPAIVVTSVRFFEALFAAKAQRCRWLHEIANSVIVFDEAQSLPPKLVRATLEALKTLCVQYGCTVVFSTATQPAFHHRPNVKWTPREIVTDSKAMFENTRRVQVEWSLVSPMAFGDVARQMARWSQVLTIVNIRRHARGLYDAMSGLCPQEELFFMSSDMCVEHRAEALKEINRRLKSGEPCKLVATQCVEAGVDFSFPVVFRSLAPLESIIQAAGRCNRNGSCADGLMVVFLPIPEEEQYPDAYYGLASQKVKLLHSRHAIDINNPEHIDEYYRLLYSDSLADNSKLIEAIKVRNYEEVERQYKLIDDHGFQVIVPYDLALFDVIRAQALQEGFTPALAAKARRITVSCANREAVKTHCEPILYRRRGAGKEAETGWYMLDTLEAYSGKTGLWFDESLKTNLYTQ